MRNLVVVVFHNVSPSSGAPRNQVAPEGLNVKKAVLNPSDTVTFVNTRPAVATFRFAEELFDGLTAGPASAYFDLTVQPNAASPSLKPKMRASSQHYRVLFPEGSGEGPVGRNLEMLPGDARGMAIPGDDPQVVIG